MWQLDFLAALQALGEGPSQTTSVSGAQGCWVWHLEIRWCQCVLVDQLVLDGEIQHTEGLWECTAHLH